MNAPPPNFHTTIPEGEEKLTIAPDTKVPNAATITLNRHDHTLANMLRSELLTQKAVIFAGYKVPHPLKPQVQIKIQTTAASKPTDELNLAVQGLLTSIEAVKEQFETEAARLEAERDAVEYGYNDEADEGGYLDI